LPTSQNEIYFFHENNQQQRTAGLRCFAPAGR
jgi:hypothetical protein